MDDTHASQPMSAPQRWLESWRRSRELRADFAGCSGAEVDRMLQDIGLTREDLDNLARNSHGPADLMPQRLAAQGIDPEKLQKFEAAVYRDMQRVCAGCRSVGRCDKDLHANNAVERNWRDYCLNAETIDALTGKPKNE